MIHTKSKWITIFRNKGEELLKQLNNSPLSKKDKSSAINKGIKSFRDN